MKEQDLSELKRAIITAEQKEEAAKKAKMQALEQERKRLSEIKSLQRRRGEFLIQPQIIDPLLKGAELISEKFFGTCLWIVIPERKDQVPILQLAVPIRTGSKNIDEMNDILRNYLDIWPVISSNLSNVMVECWDIAMNNYQRSPESKIYLQPTEYPVNENLTQIIDDNLAKLYSSVSSYSPLNKLQLGHWYEDWVRVNSLNGKKYYLDGAKTILYPSRDTLRKFTWRYNNII